jgi:hypothetical protein
MPIVPLEETQFQNIPTRALPLLPKEIITAVSAVLPLEISEQFGTAIDLKKTNPALRLERVRLRRAFQLSQSAS